MGQRYKPEVLPKSSLKTRHMLATGHSKLPSTTITPCQACAGALTLSRRTSSTVRSPPLVPTPRVEGTRTWASLPAKPVTCHAVGNY